MPRLPSLSLRVFSHCRCEERSDEAISVGLLLGREGIPSFVLSKTKDDKKARP